MVKRLHFLLFFVFCLIGPLQAEWRSRAILYHQLDSIDTALVSINRAVDENGRLVKTGHSKNWMWQMETNGEVCPETGKRFYYFRNVGTGLYLNGTDHPVADKRRAWLYSFVSRFDSTYGNFRQSEYDTASNRLLRITNNCAYILDCVTGDTIKDENRALTVHFSYDEDSTRWAYYDKDWYWGYYQTKPVGLLYDDGTRGSLDTLLAYKDSLDSRQWTPSTNYVVGQGLGQIDARLLAQLQACYEGLCQVALTDGLSAQTYDSARIAMQRLIGVADSAIGTLPNGYYRFTMKSRREDSSPLPKVLKSNGSGRLYMGNDRGVCAEELFHLVRQSSGGYSVQNVFDSLYIGHGARLTTAFLYPQHFGHGVADSMLMYYVDENNRRRVYYLRSNTVQPDELWSVAAYSFYTNQPWQVQRITDGAFIDSLRLSVAQRWRNTRLAALIDTVATATDSAHVAYQMVRSEVAAAVVEARHALTAARAVPVGTATLADIAALRQAYNALLAVWADSVALNNRLLHARRLAATVRTTGSIGSFPTYAVAELDDAAAQAEALRPFAQLTKVQTDDAATALQAAIDDFLSQIILPAEDRLYFIISNWTQNPTTGEMRQTYQRCLYADSYDAHALLKWGGTMSENEQNGLAAWRFLALGGGRFGVQNLASAWYLGATRGGQMCMSDTLVPFHFELLEGGTLGLQSEGSPLLLTPRFANHLATADSAQTGTYQAWAMRQVDYERMTDVKRFRPNAVHIVTLPYATSQQPVSATARLKWYTLAGARRDGEGRVTHLGLQLVGDDHLTAGRPYVLAVGQSIEGNGDVYVDMCLDLDNPWPDTTAIAVDGLQGTLHDLTLRRDGLAVASGHTYLQPTDASTSSPVGAQEGYVVLGRVPTLAASAQCDAMLPVARAIYNPRDHNRDGRVNLPDAVILIARVAAGNNSDADLYDHNQDGCVDAADAVIILTDAAE